MTRTLALVCLLSLCPAASLAKDFGPSFFDEVGAAGLPAGDLTYTSDGRISGNENWTAQQNATLDAVIAAHDLEAMSASAQREQALKAEPDRVEIVDKLKTATPAQIDTWIDNKVGSLADAKALLKALVKALALDGVR